MNPHLPDPRADPRADDRHDAWLDHALRHAPDASADAPAALSDAILRSARSAVAPTAPARRRQSHLWLTAWAWLARPPVAAGFGSVMVATLAGVLWSGRPLDAVLPGEPVPAPASASASERQAKVDPASPTAVISARVALPTATPAATPAPAAPLPPPSATRQADKALPSAPRAARAARLEAAPQAADNNDAPTSTLPMPPPAASPAAAVIEAPPAAPPAPMDQRQRASEAPTDDTLARAVGAAAESARRGPLQANAGPNAATSALALVRPADAGRTPLAALLAAVQREPDRWRWQRDTGNVETRAMTPNLQRWLAEAERATASQWRPATAGAALVGPPALRLLRDGVLQATLSFGPGVLIESAGDAAPKTSTAALSAAAIEALTKSLDEATR